MRYSEVNTAYLNAATQQIAGGLKNATAINTFVYEYPVVSPEAPFWVVDVTDLELEDLSHGSHRQTWSVVSYLVYKPPPEQRDDSVYPTIWQALPQALAYMQSHKRLVFADSDTSPLYLEADRVEVGIQRINEAQPGFAIVHKLPFLLTLQQE